jgi:hypothetical protein
MSKGAQTSTTSIPQYQEDAQKDVYALARQASAPGSFMPIRNPLDYVAGENQLDRTVENMALGLQQDPNLANLQNVAGMSAPMVDTASVGNLTPGLLSNTDLTPYQNPFQQQVIDNTLLDLDRARQMAVGQDQDRAISAGAFGGSRSGVLEAETNRNFADRAADISSRLRQQGFDRATRLAEGDIGRQTSADQFNLGFDQRAALMNPELALRDRAMDANLYGQLVDQPYRQIGLLSGLAGRDRSIEQAQKDAQFNEFMRRQNDPARRLGLLTSGVSGVPILPTTTDRKKTGFGDVLGALAQIGGAYAGGLGSSMGRGSDKRMKTNIKKLGTVNGINIYSWTWNKLAQSMGWDKKYQYNVGVMAQEVKHIPGAVQEDENGYLLVNYGVL